MKGYKEKERERGRLEEEQRRAKKKKKKERNWEINYLETVLSLLVIR